MAANVSLNTSNTPPVSGVPGSIGHSSKASQGGDVHEAKKI
ncbi:hypothetical protein ACFLYQ_00300 [Chloroflexota bacterium]